MIKDRRGFVSPHSALQLVEGTPQQDPYISALAVCLKLTDLSLPAGTLLPRGANFAMQSTIDFGLHFPVSTTLTSSFVLPPPFFPPVGFPASLQIKSFQVTLLT